MKKRFWKRITALACAGIMTVSGISWSPVETVAATGNALGDWNQMYSPGGYNKIMGITATAESEHANAAVKHVKDGPASYMVDNITGSWYHSHYDGISSTVTGEIRDLSANNHITLELPSATDICGITYLGRIDAADNGRWKQCTIEVSTDGTSWKSVNNKNGGAEFDIITDKNNIKDEELLFRNVENGVKKVRITVTKVVRGDKGFISAAEVAVLSAATTPEERLKEKLKQLKEYAREYDGVIYNNIEIKNVISEAEGLIAGSQMSEQDINAVITKIDEQFLKPWKTFTTSRGTGYYASDVGWDSYTSPYHGVMKDLDIDGGDKKLGLTVNGVTKMYEKGLGTHAANNYNREGNTVQFILNENFKVFEASIGRQYTYSSNTTVMFFEVYLKKNGNWELASRSAIDNTNTSETIFVDLTGASEMALVSCGLVFEGHVNWADAKFYTELTPLGEEYKALGNEIKRELLNYDFNAWYTKDSYQKYKTELSKATHMFEYPTQGVPEITANLSKAFTELTRGSENVALNKTVTASFNDPSNNPPGEGGAMTSNRPGSWAVDGQKDDKEGYSEFGLNGKRAPAYLQVDLGAIYNIEGVHMYRYYDFRSYGDTLIAVADTEQQFNDKTATVIYNGDKNDIHGFGRGNQNVYPETKEGKIFFTSDSNTHGRYVRVYMNGVSDSNTKNHIVELEVYGTPVAADYTALDQAIADATAKFADDSGEKKEWYTKDSLQAFETALQTASGMDRGLKSDQQSTIDEATRQLTDAINGLTFKAVVPEADNSYETKEYTIKADVTTKGTGTYHYNDKCILEAPPKADKIFKGWKLGEDVVYLGAGNYEFYVTGNYNFTAIYDDNVTVDPKAILKDVIVVPAADGVRSDIRFTAQIIVPEGKLLKEAGLMWGPDNRPATRKVMSDFCNKQYQFSITIKNVPADKSVHGYIYAVLKNELGGVDPEIISEERKATAPKRG